MSSPGMSPVGPPPVPEKSSKRGCIIAVVVVLLLLMGACVGGIWWMSHNAGKMMAMGINQLRPVAQQAIGADVSDEQKAAFWASFDSYSTAVSAFDPTNAAASGIDPQKLVAPMQQLQLAVSDKALSPDEIQRFIDMVRETLPAQP